VFELSSVRDGLLLLAAPAIEPGPGFETRVIEAISTPVASRSTEPRSRKWFPLALVAAGAALVASLLGGASVYLATATDRQLGEAYRATLEEGQGSFFTAVALEGPQGRVGTLFAYQGSPAWVVVTLDIPPDETQGYEVEIVTSSGEYRGIGMAELGGESQAWGASIPVDLAELEWVRLLAPDGGVAYVATLGAVDLWRSG
jgi:hypothetical protein